MTTARTAPRPPMVPLLRVLVLLLLVVATTATGFDCCRASMCSPSLARRKAPAFSDSAIFVPDPQGGCKCKEYPGRFLKCFGRLDCRRIPPNMNLTLPELRVVTSAIAAVRRGDLDRYAALKQLDLEDNNQLQRIEEHAFAELRNLVNLSISFNQRLTHLQPRTFAGLVSLRELYLVRTGFLAVPDFAQALAPRYLPSLYDLTLKEYHFEVINGTDFAPMANSSVRKLNLASCGIRAIDRASLTYFVRLEELRIGDNSLDLSDLTYLLNAMTDVGIPLKYLNLFKVGLNDRLSTSLLEAIGNSSVQCLSLAGNKLTEVITKDIFPSMKNLKLLDLRDVSASNISVDAFDNLPNLTTLLLSDNKFSEVPQGARLTTLKYLDLIRNPKSYSTSSYFNIENNTFINMTNLETLNLSFDKLKTIYKFTFAGLANLRYLSLKNCEIYDIGPKTFYPLKKLIFLDLEENLFVLSWRHLPSGDLFDGLDNLQILLLGKNNITYLSALTFSSLKTLNHLSLNDNSLIKLDPLYFKPMINLHTLDLRMNNLIQWNRRLFTQQHKLAALLLSGNRFSSFTTSMLADMTNLTNLDLKSNNFICDCVMFGNFNERRSDNLHDDEVLTVIRKSGALCFPKDEPVADYLLAADNMRLCERNYIPILAACAFMLCLVATVVVVMYMYRWHLRYYWFLTRLHLAKKGRSKARAGLQGHGNYEYDAFVSYSNEDSNFVARLVCMLENYEPFLRLCVYERDFEIGSIISESILENVSKSRRILLVISDSYVRSQWCQWETHIAQHCRIFFKSDSPDLGDDSLILIKLAAFNQKHVTPTLKYLLKTRVYLQWDEEEAKQCEFWVRLRRNLLKGRHELNTHL